MSFPGSRSEKNRVLGKCWWKIRHSSIFDHVSGLLYLCRLSWPSLLQSWYSMTVTIRQSEMDSRFDECLAQSQVSAVGSLSSYVNTEVLVGL
jgi:hypothetical protein